MTTLALASRLACAVTLGLTVVAPRALGAADPVRLVLVAIVDNVYDPGDALLETVHVGDAVRGTITFDPAAPNRNPGSDIGRYDYHQPPYGMLIEAGPYVFQTDPRHVEFSIAVANDEGTPPRDSYVMTSTRNLPLQNGSEVSRIAWELLDETHTAVDSTALPMGAPDLARWPSGFGLTLNGRSTVEFIIRAHVTEASLCTRAMRCPSPE